jgi:hypothetical protein
MEFERFKKNGVGRKVVASVLALSLFIAPITGCAIRKDSSELNIPQSGQNTEQSSKNDTDHLDQNTEEPNQNDTNQPRQKADTGTYKILNEQEQRAIFDKYNFNLDDHYSRFQISEIYAYTHEKGRKYFPIEPISFELPVGHALIYKENENMYYDVGPENQYIEDTGAGSIQVYFGGSGPTTPTDYFYENCKTETFTVDEITGSIQSYMTGTTGGYAINVESNKINGGEPAMVWYIDTDVFDDEGINLKELDELTSAIISRILQSAKFE